MHHTPIYHSGAFSEVKASFLRYSWGYFGPNQLKTIVLERINTNVFSEIFYEIDEKAFKKPVCTFNWW